MLAFILLQTLLIGTPQELSAAAESLHDPYVVYEAHYQHIDYPCGDIPYFAQNNTSLRSHQAILCSITMGSQTRTLY